MLKWSVGSRRQSLVEQEVQALRVREEQVELQERLLRLQEEQNLKEIKTKRVWRKFRCVVRFCKLGKVRRRKSHELRLQNPLKK
jgi:hypothetical protein